MFYKVVEVSRERQTGLLYVLVHFWRTRHAFDLGREPYLINDFRMQLPPDPDDARSRVRGNIRAYWKRARRVGRSGDHSLSDAVATRPLRQGGKIIRPVGSRVRAIEREECTDAELTSLQDTTEDVG